MFPCTVALFDLDFELELEKLLADQGELINDVKD